MYLPTNIVMHTSWSDIEHVLSNACHTTILVTYTTHTEPISHAELSFFAASLNLKLMSANVSKVVQ